MQWYLHKNRPFKSTDIVNNSVYIDSENCLDISLYSPPKGIDPSLLIYPSPIPKALFYAAAV